MPLPPPGGIPWPATAEGQQSVACAAHSAAPGKPQRGRGAGGCGAPAIAEPSPAKRPACQPATKQLPLFCGGALRIGLLLALGTASELLSHICKIQGSTLSLLSLVNPLPCHSHQTSHEHGTTHLMRHAHDLPTIHMPCRALRTHTNLTSHIQMQTQTARLHCGMALCWPRTLCTACMPHHSQHTSHMHSSTHLLRHAYESHAMPRTTRMH